MIVSFTWLKPFTSFQMNFKLNPNPFSGSKVNPCRLSSAYFSHLPHIITHHVLTVMYSLSPSHRAMSGAGQIRWGLSHLGIFARAVPFTWNFILSAYPFLFLFIFWTQHKWHLLKESFLSHSPGRETSSPLALFPTQQPSLCFLHSTWGNRQLDVDCLVY